MTHQDMKVVAYYSMCAYSTKRKKEMSVDDWFKVKSLVKNHPTVNKFMKAVDKNKAEVAS